MITNFRIKSQKLNIRTFIDFYLEQSLNHPFVYKHVDRTPRGWPISTIYFPPWSICKSDFSYKYASIKMAVSILYTHIPDDYLYTFHFLRLDDCVYRFYICTERLGSWPENRKRCSNLFDNCNNVIETERKDNADAYLKSGMFNCQSNYLSKEMFFLFL